MVQMKNRISGLLMETGVSHNKKRLHKVGYFRELLSANEEVQESIRPLLRLSRDTIVRMQKAEYALVSSLQRDPVLHQQMSVAQRTPSIPNLSRSHVGIPAGNRSAGNQQSCRHQYCSPMIGARPVP
jgi:hypothetical protein